MKELHVEKRAGKAWIDIANEVDAVFVCAGLGDAITAADRVLLCFLQNISFSGNCK